jgi:hypothetical protein
MAVRTVNTVIDRQQHDGTAVITEDHRPTSQVPATVVLVLQTVGN